MEQAKNDAKNSKRGTKQYITVEKDWTSSFILSYYVDESVTIFFIHHIFSNFPFTSYRQLAYLDLFLLIEK